MLKNKMAVIVAGLGLLLSVLASPGWAADIWLFRHGEKAPGKDPALTEAGQARAQRIAGLILRAPSTGDNILLYSTDYRRTQETIAPLAEATGVKVQSYDPADMAQLAAKIRVLDGTVVVAGHSNTTPELLKHLTGIERDIPEDRFDVLYHLVPAAQGFILQELSSDTSEH
ncbi:histidine phosphatase family protein [Shewanella amazonensis]|uniref:SixA phosphatase family protein n=1 Tax=Shewanella amazonensis TaxID=60478 RepID=UPI000318EEDD|nr:phosphoglycerate mutase family protein [Shewanella amazonensis]